MKALELAKGLDDLAYSEDAYCMNIFEDAAAELRRLAEVNAELLGALENILAEGHNPNDVTLYIKGISSSTTKGIAYTNAIQAIIKAKEQQ